MSDLIKRLLGQPKHTVGSDEPGDMLVTADERKRIEDFVQNQHAELATLRAALSERDRMLGEAAGLARMAQMLRRVGGVLPGVKEMINSLADDADNFLSAYDASKKEGE